MLVYTYVVEIKCFKIVIIIFEISHTAQNIAVILRQYCNVAAMLQQY